MKVLLVEQLGRKDYEYAYSAAKHYSQKYDVTVYTSADTPHDVDTTGFTVTYGFHGIYEGNKIQKGIKYLRSFEELKRFVKENRFDVIHFQWYEIPFYEKFFYHSLKKLYKPGPKIVMTIHGIIPWTKDKLKHMGLQFMYSEADAILVHSKPGVEHFKNSFKVDCPIYMIPPAFRDEADYQPIDKAEARRILGLPQDKTILLSFGTVRDDKTIDLLYKAFPAALKRNPNLFLLSGGTLNVTEKEYYKQIAEECRKTGSAKIDFAYIEKELEGVYYSAADILVVPYSYISQSGVAYYGLLYDLPMIASDIPRLDLMARGGINAEIFPKGNVEELTNRIVELSLSPEKMKEYAAASHRILKAEFSIQKRVDITEKAYDELFIQK